MPDGVEGEIPHLCLVAERHQNLSSVIEWAKPLFCGFMVLINPPGHPRLLCIPVLVSPEQHFTEFSGHRNLPGRQIAAGLLAGV